jgi:MoaA/NifB/PqqE/SkfB family radical SAM enzyme
MTIKITFKKIIKAFVPYGFIVLRRKYLQYKHSKNSRFSEKLSPKKYIENLVIPLVEHCNLKCRGCDHCAPLAEEIYYSVDDFSKDMARLRFLTKGNIGRIKLMGGEPLLHPQILEFVKISRELFQDSEIIIVTNGILLSKQTPDFWETLHSFNVNISPTVYPLKINWDKIKETANNFNVKLLDYYSAYEIKTSYHIPFDVNGKQNKRVNFINCSHANELYEMRDGKLYTCTPAPNSKHFFKYFKMEQKLGKNDSIDIYEAVNYKQIMRFLAKPIPFCRFCNVKDRKYGLEWKRSEKKITEWT